MDEGTAPNIQNEYFNTARREKRRVAVFLNSGRRLTGRIRSFDKFTILLDTAQGEQMIFKHAIATLGPIPAPVRPSRVKEGFKNRMEIGKNQTQEAGSSEPSASGGETISGDSGEKTAPRS
jgi:host factor-I protein